MNTSFTQLIPMGFSRTFPSSYLLNCKNLSTPILCFPGGKSQFPFYSTTRIYFRPIPFNTVLSQEKKKKNLQPAGHRCVAVAYLHSDSVSQGRQPQHTCVYVVAGGRFFLREPYFTFFKQRLSAISV